MATERTINIKIDSTQARRGAKEVTDALGSVQGAAKGTQSAFDKMAQGLPLRLATSRSCCSSGPSPAWCGASMRPSPW